MAGLIQVKRKTSLTVTETFMVDGVAIDTDAALPTLAATFPDGTALSPLPAVSGSWTGRTTGQYRFGLSAQPEVTWLDYELTGTIGGLPQTVDGRVEWVGEMLFNLADLRGLKVGNGYPFAADAVNTPSDAKIQQARTQTLDEFTRRLGFSPVPRYARETHSGNGRTTLVLACHKATKLLSVSVDGVAQTIGNYVLDRSGVLTATTGSFTSGTGNIAVEYVHGWDRVMGDGSDMAMFRAAMILAPSQFATATSVSLPDGSTYTYDMAGSRNAAGDKIHFGHRAIAEWINESAERSLAVA